MKHLQKSRCLIGRFRRQRQGTAAIEFALVFPILILVYFGLIEISNGFEVRRKVENAANLTGMLVAQAEEVNVAYMNNIYEASEMAFEPLDATPLKVVITSIQRIFKNGAWVNEVAWSDSHGAGASSRAVGSVIDPPGDILGDNRGIILTEVEYKYKRILPVTIFNDYFPNEVIFKRSFWSHPRYVNSIPFI